MFPTRGGSGVRIDVLFGVHILHRVPYPNNLSIPIFWDGLQGVPPKFDFQPNSI